MKTDQNTQDAKPDSNSPDSYLIKTKDVFSSIRSIVFSLSITVLLFVVAIVVYREVTREYLIVEPVEVPEDFVKKGYTGTVLARYLIDELNRIKRIAVDSTAYTQNALAKNVIMNTTRDMPDLNFEIPETKVSFPLIINFFRVLLNHQPKPVSSEIFIEKDSLIISSRYNKEFVFYKCLVDSMRPAINHVALELSKKIQPIITANYFLAINENTTCKRFIDYQLASLNLTDSSEAHTILGIIALNNNDYKQADRYLAESIKENPNNALAHNILGILRFGENKYSDAINHYTQSINLNPKSASPYNNLGYLYYKLGNRKEAEALYHQAIARNPKYARAYNNLGILKDDDDSTRQQAEELYRQAIARNPKFSDAYYNLALIRTVSKNYKEAEELFNVVIKLDSKNSSAYNNIGYIKYEQGNYIDASKFCMKAIEISPKYAVAHHSLGEIRDAEGKCEDAEKCYRNALNLNHNYILAYHNLGNLKMNMGHPEEAKVFYELSKRVNTKK